MGTSGVSSCVALYLGIVVTLAPVQNFIFDTKTSFARDEWLRRGFLPAAKRGGRTCSSFGFAASDKDPAGISLVWTGLPSSSRWGEDMMCLWAAAEIAALKHTAFTAPVLGCFGISGNSELPNPPDSRSFTGTHAGSCNHQTCSFHRRLATGFLGLVAIFSLLLQYLHSAGYASGVCCGHKGVFPKNLICSCSCNDRTSVKFSFVGMDSRTVTAVSSELPPLSPPLFGGVLSWLFSFRFSAGGSSQYSKLLGCRESVLGGLGSDTTKSGENLRVWIC